MRMPVSPASNVTRLRRVNRQGAMMGAPDYAHWHGFFELQQDLYKLEGIHKKRMESGEIE